MFTQSRALEVCNRCQRAMNFLSYVALSVGTPNEYGYRMGLLSPEDQDVLIWLVSLIVLSSTWVAPPEGEWVEQEAEALIELFEEGWTENVRPHVPPILRNFVDIFRAGELTWGDNRLICACEERTSPQDVLL
jgi:hypothetical protein